ncbi:hypothetical protein HYPSUDRAFT_206578 [Hypholoma sublateritium FD-334 SS-4]|uniref:Uncharacterized protein n=1 Tax=Hypholoma sublateritium (strain FD-334 SS-4) TaxID=945553 RepID=A0A0D2NKA0_HYPSF|nr:hypothetical protein HYPSUDRAFT_206578 [Hypholoma sublateritium FD-334 SS-4]
MASDRAQHAARVKPKLPLAASNKAKTKWHQRGGAALALPHREGPLIIKRGLDKMKLNRAPDPGAHQWHDSPSYAFERVSAECAPSPLASAHTSVAYDGEQPMHHAISSSAIYPGFAKLARLSSPSKTISHHKNISPKKRSALRVKSKIGAIGGIRAQKRGAEAKNGPAKVQSMKRSRTILPSALGDLLGKMQDIGANANARNKKTRAKEDRRDNSTFERMVEPRDDMQLSAMTTDVEMLPSSAASPGFRWRSCFAFLAGTWRERRDSVDSTYSNPMPVSPSDSKPLLDCPSSLTFIFGEGDHNSDEEIGRYARDEDPFEQPLPSATPSAMSMASVDGDSDDSSAMDSFSDGATTPTMHMLDGSANQMLRSQHDHTQAKMAKLSRFFGPEVLLQF